MQAELEVQLKMKMSEVWRAQEAFKHSTKEKDALLKRQKKLENVMSVLQAVLPGLEAQKSSHNMELERTALLLKRQSDVCPLRVPCLHAHPAQVHDPGLHDLLHRKESDVANRKTSRCPRPVRPPVPASLLLSSTGALPRIAMVTTRDAQWNGIRQQGRSA